MVRISPLALSGLTLLLTGCWDLFPVALPIAACPDNDSDGHSTCGGDCDDTDAAVSPDAAEICDGVDNNCDLQVDEDGVCDAEIECAPPSECLPFYEAHALDLIEMVSDGGFGASVTILNNSVEHSVCIDEQSLYHSDISQRFFIGDEPIADGIEIAPGDSYTVYFGSWTTPNGLRELYLGEPPFWCADDRTPYAPNAIFVYTGEGVPDPFPSYPVPGWDTDGDGIDDLEDWGGSNGVVAQRLLWNYQKAHAPLSVGKAGRTAACGVDIMLTARNNGDVVGAGTVTDTIPAGWTVTSTSQAPDSETANSDGTTTLTWDVSLDTRNTSGAFVEITYSLEADDGIDRDRVSFGRASIDYNDGATDRTSSSLPVGLYDVDLDCDGAVSCEPVCVTYDLGDAGEHNVFVFGDYDGGVDVQGKAAAGGTATMSGFSVGHLNPGGDAIVADTLALSNGMVHGDAVYDSSASVPESVGFGSGGALAQGTPIDFVAAQAALEATSAGLCAQADTGTVSLDGYGGVTLSGSNSVDVYALDVADLESATGVTIAAPSGAVAVINVAGVSSATIGNFAIWLSGIDETGILWNFCDATSLDFWALGVEGTVLAPLADVTFDNGNFDGNFIAASLDGNAEGHHYPFAGSFEICE